MTITLYGISNCDSVKKVRTLLNERGIDYTFHDYKKQGVPERELTRWVEAKGWDIILNRKGTSWRALDDATKANVVDAAAAIAVMRAQPSTIKRPIVTRGETIVVGLDIAALEKL